MVRSRRLLPLLLALFTVAGAMTLPAAPAHAQWQQSMAQANTYYRNRLLPKALEALKMVVQDPEGAKQMKAWQLIIQISTKMKDLDTLIWALEKGRELAQGQQAAQMQAQLYRLKRIYGRVMFEAAGGSGKLPTKGLKLKVKEDISDPEAKAYYEKARVLFSQLGYSRGSYYLPTGVYDLDGEELKIVGGKDTKIEVAPTTSVSFGLEVVGTLGARGGDVTTGAAGFMGGLEVGVGPHIQFASGSSLFLNVGPVAVFGAQSTTDVAQDLYQNDNRARLSVGGFFEAAFEFAIGQIDISPRVGYAIQGLPGGLYYSGRVSSGGNMLDGHYVVSAVAHGPRLGIHALVSPAMVKGKQRPRLFVGVKGGPLWAQPQWSETTAGSGLSANPTTVRSGTLSESETTTANGLLQETYTASTFGSESAPSGAAITLVDIRVVIGVQLRL